MSDEEEKSEDKSLPKVLDGVPRAAEEKTIKNYKIPKVLKNSTAEQISETALPKNQTQLPPPLPLMAGIKFTETNGAKRMKLQCTVPPLPLKPPTTNLHIGITTHRNHHDLFTSTSSVDIAAYSPFEFHSRGQFAGRGGEGLNRGIAVLDIAKIFGVTCLPFLVNTCKILANSPQHIHQFFAPNLVKVTLESLGQTELNVAYRFIVNHRKLFYYYFYTFCDVYASRKNRAKLMNMIYDCEKHPKCAEFLRAIFYGLINCGLNKVNACRQILSRCRDMSPTTIDILVDIIFEADWGMFFDYLERYSETKQYKLRINILNQMAPRVLRTKDPRLSDLIFKCLLELNSEEALLVQQSPDLMQLLTLMKEGKVF